MSDIKTGQFGKIGENMVAFELSKRGWIVFLPPYDERVDITAMKVRCSDCFSNWNVTHNLHCSNSNCIRHREIAKSAIIKTKKCSNCLQVFTRSAVSSQSTYCPNCELNTLSEFPKCNVCDEEVVVSEKCCKNSNCNSSSYEIIFRSIQVKSTHYVDNGTNLGFNFKYQDLLDDERHFFIVYLRDINKFREEHHYWVMSKNDFTSIKNVDTTAFKIYQNDRGHYNPNALVDYKYDEEMTNRLLEKLKKATAPSYINIYKALLKKYDPFLKLDD